MSSPGTGATPATAAPVGRRHRLGRHLLKTAAWALVAPFLLLAVVVFIASRTMTLQWVAQQAVRLSDGKLQIEGITGSVLREVSADAVRWQDRNLAVTIVSPRFTYHPLALLDGLIRVERISAADVQVELTPGPAPSPRTPLRLPQSLTPLLPVAIERIDAGRVIVRRDGQEQVSLHNLDAVLRHDGDRITASVLQVEVVAARGKTAIRGEVAVLARAPYATDGRLIVQVPVQPQPLRVDMRVNGPLEELSVRGAAVVAGALVEARTTFHPLDPRPLRQVRLDLKDFDLSGYDPALPATRLTGSYEAEVMPAWASERKPLLIGPLKLENALPGPLDAGVLPISGAKAVVAYVDGRFEVQGLQAEGPLGEIAGDGWAGPDGFRLAVGSDKVLLRGIVSTLAPRTLTAKIVIEPKEAGAGSLPAGGAIAGPGALSVEMTAGDASLAADLSAVFDGSQLQISRARVQSKPGRRGGAGQAAFHGTIGAVSPWPLDLSGDFHGFEPARLVEMPPTLLNGTWQLSGRAAGADGGRFTTAMKLADSRLGGLPLAGRLTGVLSLDNHGPQRLSDVAGALTWGSSTVEASGALGEASDTLQLLLNVPKVAEVRVGAEGGLRARATLRGSLREPAVEAVVDGRRLAATMPGVRASVAAATVRLRSAPAPGGMLDLQAALDQVEVARVAPGAGVGAAAEASRAGARSRAVAEDRPRVAAGTLLRFDRMTAAIEGSHADHEARLSGVGKDQRLVAAARGGWGDDGIWRGMVQRLGASHPLLGLPPANGPETLHLRRPFALTAGAGLASVRGASFELQDTILNLKQADWREEILTISADAGGLPASWLRWLIRTGALQGSAERALQDLRLAAALDFGGNLSDATAAGWRGRLELKRESGDLRLTALDGSGEVEAGLRTLRASATLDSRKVHAVVDAEAENLGRIAVEARSTLQGNGGPVWSEASLGRSPLDGRIELATDSFRWIPRLAGQTWSVDGALDARLQLAGTLASPQADGFVSGSNLSADEQVLGMRLKNGVLAAELAEGRVHVRMLRFESGEGSVAISGLLQSPGDGRSEARVVLDRLLMPLGEGQRVVLSGSTTAVLEEHSLNVAGRLVANEGVIALRDAEASEVFSEVGGLGGGKALATVLGDGPMHDAAQPLSRPALRRTGAGLEPPRAGSPGPAAGASGTFGIFTDVGLDLGRHFRAAGSGFETQLKGSLRLRGGFPQLPHALGNVDLLDGSYQFHGRRLRIRHGRLAFDGPLDNPSLDIVAVREHLALEPGVEVRGPAVLPTIRLVSDPDVDDAEKLSWLVLGTGLQDPVAAQMPHLQAVASALLGSELARQSLAEESGPLNEKTAMAELLSVPDFGIGAPLFGRSYGGGPADRYDASPQASADAASEASPGGSRGSFMTAAQQLSSRLSETCEKSLRAVWVILKLQFEIGDRLSSGAQSVSDGAAGLPGPLPSE